MTAEAIKAINEVLDDSVHYYIRRMDTKAPVACVAIKPHDDGTVSRGISICSFDEPFKRDKGRNKARGRLVKALKNKKDDLPIRTDVSLECIQWYFFELGGMVSTGGGISMTKYKSCYCDQPTDMERKMLEKPPEVHDEDIDDEETEG